MSLDTFSGWFKRFIKKTDLPDISLHSLRHTNAALLIAGGENVRTVSRRLGHSQTSTTLNIYSHAIESPDARAAQTLENLLSPLSSKKK
jgi:integrase